MVEIWKLAESVEPPTSPHKMNPNKPVRIQDLEKIGIHYEQMNADETNYKTDPALTTFAKDRDYNFSDILTVSKEALKNYDESLKCFYKEHFHPDDECRFVLEGIGYFDVRDNDDDWVRIKIEKGDLITLPAGMYHRFTLDDSVNYVKYVRMFVAEPIWTPVFRNDDGDDHFSRKEYLKKYKINLKY